LPTVVAFDQLSPNAMETPMSGQTSFKMDVLPLFTERDIKGMSRAFDLTDYKAVKAHAEAIRDRIRGIGGSVMPP
jgi:hypothetical protein